MPNDGEGYFTRVAIGLQGALADAEPAAYGFIVKPFVRFGRIADKLFNTVDKVCKFGAEPLPRFAVDDNEFHCLNFVLITLLLREFGIRKGLKKLVISSKIRIFIGENQ